MELRELHTIQERSIFAIKLTEARSSRGVGFRETAHSEIGKAHIQFGSLYALFENATDSVERMVGGFILHDLAKLPQSFPKPDLAHLPARQVIEAGELWSLSKGIAKLAAGATAGICAIRQAKAILVYPILKPQNLAIPYGQFGFVNASEPVKWPFAETSDGGDVWVQPMVLDGTALERYLTMGSALFGAAGASLGLVFSDEITAASASKDPTAASAMSNADSADRPVSPTTNNGTNGSTYQS